MSWFALKFEVVELFQFYCSDNFIVELLFRALILGPLSS
jgi:hypothetical protein